MTVAEPSTWLDDYVSGEVYEVRLTSLLDQWMWRVEAADRVELRSTATAKCPEIQHRNLAGVDLATVVRFIIPSHRTGFQGVRHACRQGAH